MELEFKKDFEAARKSWMLMWEGRLNRPILLATIPKKGTEPVSIPKWGAAFSEGAEGVVRQTLRWASTHEFLGDAIPVVTPSLLIDLIPAFLGAEVLSVAESWGVDTHAVPFIKELKSAEIKFQRSSPWWERWTSLCERIKSECAGRLVMGSAYPGYNNLDTLAAIRGSTELMMDFYDDPASVHQAMRHVMTAFNEIVDEHCRMFSHEFKTYGCATHHGFYSDGLVAVPQCDFGFNIGKELFDEFALPYLKQEIERLDSVEYHLDGTGNITHVESICGIGKIGVIQWVPGMGNEGEDWTALYGRISLLGKGLWLSAESPEAAKRLWDNYGASGRMVLNIKAESERDIERYLSEFPS